MKQWSNRREFIMACAGVAAGLRFGVRSSAGQTAPRPGADRASDRNLSTPAAPPTLKTKLHKALIARPTADDLKRIKDAGFEGVEVQAA